MTVVYLVVGAFVVFVALAALFGRADFPGLDRIRATPPPSVPYDGAGLCMP